MNWYEILVCEIKVDLANHDNSVTIDTKHFCFAIFRHILNLSDIVHYRVYNIIDVTYNMLYVTFWVVSSANSAQLEAESGIKCVVRPNPSFYFVLLLYCCAIVRNIFTVSV